MAYSVSIHKSDGYPTKTSMRVWVELTVTNAGKYTVRFQVYDAYQDEVIDVYGTTLSLSAGQSYGGKDFYKTFTGLDHGTGYEVIATLYNASTGKSTGATDNLWFDTESDLPPRPSDWSWETKNISRGSAMNGIATAPKPLTASEWLKFIDRIKAFYEHYGKAVDSTYVYRATNGVSKGSPMTATQANAARYLINQLGPSTAVPDRVSSGDDIAASFINGLRKSLNSL